MSNWQIKSFSQLTTTELYKIIQQRIDVFVVEQQTMYSDLDDKDCHPDSMHVFLLTDDTLKAYLRILPPDIAYQGAVAIGRVLIHHSHRNQKLGHEMMRVAIEQAISKWPNAPIKLSAQYHLQNFYQKHGFKSYGEQYLEDGIPHIGMVRQVNTPTADKESN